MIRLLLIMSIFSILGCGNRTQEPAPVPIADVDQPAAGNDTVKSEPADDGQVRLERFYHTATHGFRGFTNRGYRAELLPQGKVRITVELGDDRNRVFETEASFMDSLDALIQEYRMDRYKEFYKPRDDVKDGDSWELSFKYSDGRKLYSHGYFEMPRGAHEAFKKVESLFAKWRDMEPEAELVAFRYELYTKDEGTEVFWFKKDEYHNAVYFRKMGSLEGWNYYCGDPTVLEKIDKEMRWAHACSYSGCGEKLSDEDTSRPRWIAILEYADGSKFELIDYLDREHDYRNEPLTNTERVLRYVSETVFGDEIQRIGTLTPEELGEHTCTTYKADGSPSRKMNYAGDGTVLNGYDYNDPMKDF